MPRAVPQPFSTVESAQEFMALLQESIAATMRDIEADIAEARQTDQARRLEALLLAQYKLDKLGGHINNSASLLKDIRRLREILLPDPEAPRRRNVSVRVASAER